MRVPDEPTYRYLQTLLQPAFEIRFVRLSACPKQPKLLADNQFHQSGCSEDNQLFRIKNIIIHMTIYLFIIEWTTKNCGGQPRILGRLSAGQIHARRLQIVIRGHKSRITQIPPTSFTCYTFSGALI